MGLLLGVGGRHLSTNYVYDWLGDTPTGQAANMTFPWADSGSHIVETDALGVNNLHEKFDLAANTNQVGKLTLIPDAADIDIFYIFSAPSVDVTTPRNGGFIALGSGDNTTKGGFRLCFNATVMFAGRFVNNVSTDPSSVAFAISTNTLYAVRFQIRSATNAIRAKVWAWSDVTRMADEPGSWMIDAVDANITAAGFCGPWSQRSSGVDYYHYISANIGGGQAPGP
jgi:hypothetical protein